LDTLAVNRHYFATASVPTVTDLQDIADAYHSWWIASLQAVVTAVWSLVDVTCRSMNEAEGLEIHHTDGLPSPGLASATDSEAFSIAYTITWQTGLVGRSARGRTYGIGLPRSMHNETRLHDTDQANLNVRWNNLLSIMETAGHAMQVVSFQDSSGPRTEGRALPVIDGQVRFPLASQRRRLS
jgi:hypothetical protein